MSDSCHWTKDRDGMVPLTEMVSQPPSICPVPPDVRGFYLPQVVYDKHGHRLTGDFDPLGKNGCDHRNSPEWKAEHQYRKGIKMETMTAVDSTTVADMTTIASVGVPVPPVATQKADTDAAMVVVIGLLGGFLGTGVTQLIAKLLKSRKKVNKVEPPKENKEPSTDCKAQHMKCTISYHNTNNRIAAIDERLVALESNEDLDIDSPFSDKVKELVERVEKLEKKKPRATKKKK